MMLLHYLIVLATLKFASAILSTSQLFSFFNSKIEKKKKKTESDPFDFLSEIWLMSYVSNMQLWTELTYTWNI